MKLLKRGQISLKMVWMILAIIFLVIGAIIIFNIKGTGSNYLARFYDWIRFGGNF